MTRKLAVVAAVFAALTSTAAAQEDPPRYEPEDWNPTYCFGDNGVPAIGCPLPTTIPTTTTTTTADVVVAAATPAAPALSAPTYAG